MGQLTTWVSWCVISYLTADAVPVVVPMYSWCLTRVFGVESSRRETRPVWPGALVVSGVPGAGCCRAASVDLAQSLAG